jgi:GntR family transcriptional regulator of arabinose operon
MATMAARGVKHREVFSALKREIQAGRWKRGDRLPSEAELIGRFGVSRITISRAVRDLQQAGLVERRAGSGTFIRGASASAALTFGLLIPDLGETEIFEPICQGIMASPHAREHALIWGAADAQAASKAERAWRLCAQYIDRRVSGVFFAPLESAADTHHWNERIGRALDDARIPLVLLDRTLGPYPDAGRHDLVGIDNRRAGFVVTSHLLGLGARRVAFVAEPHAASTVDARAAGYREALFVRGVPVELALVSRLDPADREAVGALMRSARPDAAACANDRTAAGLMRTLLALGYRIPDDVRLAGIDDVEYAQMLPVPLTTLRQPTHQIGEAALDVMLDRVSRRERAARHVYLHADLIVRESSGASR